MENTHKNCRKCCINNKRPTGQKQQLLDERTVENKGKLILTEIFPSVQKHDISKYLNVNSRKYKLVNPLVDIIMTHLP